MARKVAVSKSRRSRRGNSGSNLPDPVDGRRASPPHRRLRVYSLDPAADIELSTSLISRCALSLPWEDVTPGPIGEYLEVIDIDPSSGCVYDPVDLDDPFLLAQDGLAPSTGNPQFHQQMVYAVAMKTIANFEQVLGRRVLWSERSRQADGQWIKETSRRYVQRLRIYPHALREQNAYYSPTKAALLFGYFNAPSTDPRDELPGGLVFTCLSHDVVAHEMTHAILDGMHRRLLDPSNHDMIAFHEAFADIVAIFQHFTLPGLLLDQIQKTRGDLEANNLLATLAAQFARATGRGSALRNALGRLDAQGRRLKPDPGALGRTFEPHERGAILVAAVFDAFLRMYNNRVSDLRRLATGGSGVLPEGAIHPDLANRLSSEAVRLAQRVLNMCIRAVDYLPPVDVTFGDYLRALITADSDFYPDDARRYRLAFIEAFRDRGIYPLDVKSLGEDSLKWARLDTDRDAWELVGNFLPPAHVLRTMIAAYDSDHMAGVLGDGAEFAESPSAEAWKGEIWDRLKGLEFDVAARLFIDAAWQPPDARSEDAGLGSRYQRFRLERMLARFLHGWIEAKARDKQVTGERARRLAWHLGLDVASLGALKVRQQDKQRIRLEIQSIRPTIRLRADGRSKMELLVVLTQRVRSPLLDEEGQPMHAPDGTRLEFWQRGGCTLIIDPEIGGVTYAVSKQLTSEFRIPRQMAFLRTQLAQHGSAAIVRFGLTDDTIQSQFRLEPFALAHVGREDKGTY
jgi:hypothetical protein